MHDFVHKKSISHAFTKKNGLKGYIKYIGFKDYGFFPDFLQYN